MTGLSFSTGTLGKGDLQILQSALADLYADVRPETLVERTFRFAGRLIPADSVSFDCFGGGDPVMERGWRNSDTPITPELMEIYRTYAHQNPVYVDVVQNKRLDPVMLSDYMSVAEFEKTDIYRQFFGHIEARYQMATALWVTADFTVTCVFCASKRDFTERDRMMFSLASPHLMNVIRNAFQLDQFGAALETRNTGLLAIDRNGKIDFASTFVQKLLPKYFPDHSLDKKTLPRTISEWLGQSETTLPFRVVGDNTELVVRLLKGDSLEPTLLFEEQRTISPKTLEPLGLTKREAEVLFWISQGKSDGDIAELCDISRHTASKHVQNIYIKLGVETRTAAMLRAIEAL